MPARNLARVLGTQHVIVLVLTAGSEASMI
jgi:hypothetical protein